MADEETLYARILSGALTPKEKEQLIQNGDLEKIEKIISMTDSFELPPMDKAAGFERLVAQKRATPKDNVRQLPIWRWVSGVAAAALIAFGIFQVTRSSTIALESPYAQTLEHTFDDQSTAMLNADSRISFDQGSWKDNRAVELTGEAYFQVTKGSPFTVQTTSGAVEVLGTAFNVYARSNRLAVECFEGKVRVTAQGVDQVLTPNQGIEIRNTATTNLYEVSSQNIHWQNGRSSFRNAPLAEVFKELERQFDIRVSSSGIQSGTFKGSFDNNDLDSAVEEIAKPLGLKAVVSSDKKRVTFSK